jgi:hypothetical protein
VCKQVSRRGRLYHVGRCDLARLPWAVFPLPLPARISPRSYSSLLESPFPSPFLICAVRRWPPTGGVARSGTPAGLERSPALRPPGPRRSGPYSAWRAWVRGINGADRGPEHPLHNGAAGTEVPPREHCIAVSTSYLSSTAAQHKAGCTKPRPALARAWTSCTTYKSIPPHNLRRRARPTSVSGEKLVIAILHDIPESACASAYFQRIALRWE